MSLIIPFFIHHRGCPHRCLFCNQAGIAGPNRENSDDPVKDLGRTIDRWLERSPQREEVQVAFYGGSFTCLDEDVQVGLLQRVNPYMKKGLVRSIRLSTRPDCITDEIADFLITAGVRTVEIGAQSMNNKVLQKAGRGHTAEQVINAIQLLGVRGMETGIQLMAGLPGESTRSFLDGVRTVIGLSPDLVRLYPTLVMEHTELAELYLHSDWRPLSLERAVSLIARAWTMLDEHRIRVIRMGLQPTAELEKQLIAGPYHPAFGELVKSRCWYRKIRSLLVRAGRDKTLRLTINDRDYSALAGQRRENLERLEKLAHGARLEVDVDASVERGHYRYIVY
ncbi:MAG: radical SAM protein [Desulfofustis sp.]|nr:radical SAM protein [Desulfofustis sp.]NNK55764.1 radical SAM protein [Desulfofustis sp.]